MTSNSKQTVHQLVFVFAPVPVPVAALLMHFAEVRL